VSDRLGDKGIGADKGNLDFDGADNETGGLPTSCSSWSTARALSRLCRAA